MSLTTKIREYFQAPIRAYREYEAGLDLKTWTFGGTGVPFNSGNWVDSDRPGNRYSNWAPIHGLDGIVGAMHLNSAYMACLAAYQDAFSQAPVIIKKMQADGSKTPEPNHELMELLENINQSDDSVTLLDGTLADYLTHGNAYWLITKMKGAPDPVELEFIPSRVIKPKTARDLGREPRPGDPAILEYEYTPDEKPERVPVDKIVHIRRGKDPWCPYMGLGCGSVLTREVFSDNEVMSYTAAILANMGVSPQIFSPKPPPQGMTSTGFSAEAVVKEIQQNRTGGKRGNAVALDMLLDVFESSSNPENMALDKIARINESRVAAVTRVPAQVVGLMAGDDVKTYSNYEEAREAFWQDSVLPMMRRIRSQVTRQLIWRNPKYKDRTIWFGFNYDEVPALQVDEQARDKNIRENFKYQLVTAGEARSQMGLDPLPGDEARMFAAVSGKPGDEEDEEEKALAKMMNPLARITEEYRLLTEREDSLNGHHEESLSTVE